MSRARQSLARKNRNGPSLRRTVSVRGWAVICTFVTWGLAPCAARAQAANTVANQPESAEVPTLGRIVALAVQRAPEVALSRSALRASRSSLVGARLWPMQNPYVEVLATHSDRGINQGTTVMGTAWLPFELSGQRGRRIAEADAFVGTHTVELERAQALARAAALRAWGRTVVEAERIRTLTEIAASAQAEARAFLARRDAGDATERDAQLAQVEHARHVVLVEEAQVALEGAMGEMSRITGRTWMIPSSQEVHPDITQGRLDAKSAAAKSPIVRTSQAEAYYFAQTDSRLARDAVGPFTLMLSGGRGSIGDTVLGAGVAWTLPSFRRFQGERARAQSEQERALVQSEVIRREIETRLQTIIREMTGVRRALGVLSEQALPAALKARQAAEQMFLSGKIDILSVLVSRRDEAQLRLRHLDLAEREWDLTAEWTELTGELP